MRHIPYQHHYLAALLGPIATLPPGNIVIIKMIITISTTLIQHAGTMGPSDE